MRCIKLNTSLLAQLTTMDLYSDYPHGFQTDKMSEKQCCATMLKKSVLVCVRNLNEAKIARNAGASLLIPVDPISSLEDEHPSIKSMVATKRFQTIKDSVDIPVVGRIRVGHTVEAEMMEHLKADFIEESPQLDKVAEPVDKTQFRTPFIASFVDFASAVREIELGAVALATAVGPNPNNIIQTITAFRDIKDKIKELKKYTPYNIYSFANSIGLEQSTIPLLLRIQSLNRLPVITFAGTSGVSPADVAMIMKEGMDGCIIPETIFNFSGSSNRLQAMIGVVAASEKIEHVVDRSLTLSSNYKVFVPLK